MSNNGLLDVGEATLVLKDKKVINALNIGDEFFEIETRWKIGRLNKNYKGYKDLKCYEDKLINLLQTTDNGSVAYIEHNDRTYEVRLKDE